MPKRISAGETSASKGLLPSRALGTSVPHTEYETSLRARGFAVIAGVDEAGRGPLAGPVVAAAVVLPVDFPGEGINDSKMLSAEKRERLYATILHQAAVGIGLVEVEMIDRINILQATYLAMSKSVAQLHPAPDHVLVDGRSIGRTDFCYTPIVKGDRVSLSIAAASIIAKVTRDRIMLELDRRYPDYGFAKHKGYATSEHLSQLARHGPCPAHRKSFAPVRLLCRDGSEQRKPRGRESDRSRSSQLSLGVESL